jgi:hypothetical protein
MRAGIVLPVEILFHHPRIRSTEAAVAYIREAVAALRASGLEVVDWSFDPARPSPILGPHLHEAHVRLLVAATMAEYGAVLVRLLLVFADLAGNVGVVVEGNPEPHPIGSDYVPGEAFPVAMA